MSSSFRSLFFNDDAVVVAVVLIIVLGTIRRIGSKKAKTLFSNVARAVRRLERALLPKKD